MQLTEEQEHWNHHYYSRWSYRTITPRRGGPYDAYFRNEYHRKRTTLKVKLRVPNKLERSYY